MPDKPGSSWDKPVKSLGEAMKLASTEGSGITIYMLPEHGHVVLEGSDAKIKIGSTEIEIGGDMPQGSAHERMRFGTMTERQLWTRLGKITTHAKYLNFAAMAREFGHEALAIAAEARLKVATGEKNLSLDGKKKAPKPIIDGKRLTRKIST